MAKLKIRLEKWEKVLVFQVLEMDESLRGSVDFEASNGIKIASPNVPVVHTNSIALWGNWKTWDFIIQTVYFDSNEERDEHYDKIVAALREWEKTLTNEPVEEQEGVLTFG